MNLPFETFIPDIEQLYKVLRREKTERPVLFEFIINLETCREAAGRDRQPEPGTLDYYRMVIEAFRNLGYDSAPVYTFKSGLFSFPKGEQDSLASRSQNQGSGNGPHLRVCVSMLRPSVACASVAARIVTTLHRAALHHMAKSQNSPNQAKTSKNNQKQ